MISVLIPTYNYNVYPLVLELHRQLTEPNIIFEIICVDDGSSSELNNENEKINLLNNCKFIASEINVGLSNNRNTLVGFSKYKYILFIDGDSIINDDEFVENYLEALKKDTDVIYGGRNHPNVVTPDRKLRWKYGKFREDKTAKKRQLNKYKCTLFNNTLIKRSVFNKIGFEKSIHQYGHEDTIFSYNLYSIQATILHINNPVIHGDVDLNTVYFYKMHKSLENLNTIYCKKLIDPNFVTLLKYYNKLKIFRLNYLFKKVHYLLYPFFKHNLCSNSPYLFVFDLFRLSYFCHINLKR